MERSERIGRIEEKIKDFPEEEQLFLRERMAEGMAKLSANTKNPDVSISSFLESIEKYLDNDDGRLSLSLKKFKEQKVKTTEEDEELMGILRAYAKYWSNNVELQKRCEA